MLSSIHTQTASGSSIGKYTDLNNRSRILQRRKIVSSYNHESAVNANRAKISYSNSQPERSILYQPGFTTVVGTNQPIIYAWSFNGSYWWIRDKIWLSWIRFSTCLGISTMEGWEALISGKYCI